jgi:hypothetical protein
MVGKIIINRSDAGLRDEHHHQSNKGIANCHKIYTSIA